MTEVLNDQLERGLRFNFRGDMLEGVIIAYGCQAIPETYHGAVSVRVTLIDALERTVQTEIELLVGERVSKRDQNPVRPGGGQYIPDERENTNAVLNLCALRRLGWPRLCKRHFGKACKIRGGVRELWL